MLFNPTSLVSFVLSFALARSLSTELSPKPIIIDTDIFSDVDDVGAIAVANALHNCGMVDLQAVVINTPSEYGALAASVSTVEDVERLDIGKHQNRLKIHTHLFQSLTHHR